MSQELVPAPVREALASVGLHADTLYAEPSIEHGGDVRLSLHLRRYDGAATLLRTVLSPTLSSTGAAAGAMRRFTKVNGDLYTWAARPRCTPWGSDESDADVAAEMRSYRADAALWHAVAGGLAQEGRDPLVTMARVAVGRAERNLLVPTIIDPSFADDEPASWTALAWLGTQPLHLEGQGLFSVAVLDMAVQAATDEATLAAPPGDQRCSSTAHRITLDQDWGDASHEVRIVQQLLGLCQQCAASVLCSQAADAPVQPTGWGEKVS